MASIGKTIVSVEKKIYYDNLQFIFIRKKITVTAYDFIFSEKRKHRLVRHLTFWSGFCLLKFCSAVYPDSPAGLLTLNLYKVPLLSLICFIPLYIFSVYSFIYILLPRYLQRRRYGAFIVSALILAVCNFIFGIFLSLLFLKITGMDLYLMGTLKSLAHSGLPCIRVSFSHSFQRGAWSLQLNSLKIGMCSKKKI